jgi:hypothetical protein
VKLVRDNQWCVFALCGHLRGWVPGVYLVPRIAPVDLAREISVLPALALSELVKLLTNVPQGPFVKAAYTFHRLDGSLEQFGKNPAQHFRPSDLTTWPTSARV